MGYRAVLEARIVAVCEHVAGDGEDDDEHHRVHHAANADDQDQNPNRPPRVDAVVERQDGQLGQGRGQHIRGGHRVHMLTAGRVSAVVVRAGDAGLWRALPTCRFAVGPPRCPMCVCPNRIAMLCRRQDSATYNQGAGERTVHLQGAEAHAGGPR